MASTSGKEGEIPSSRSVLKSIMAGCSRRRTVGWMEGLKRAMGEDLLDPDDNPKCRDLGHPRQDASDPRSEPLRPMARSGNAERRSDLGTVEAL